MSKLIKCPCCGSDNIKQIPDEYRRFFYKCLNCCHDWEHQPDLEYDFVEPLPGWMSYTEE